jgi:hypothetical protein
MSSWQLSPQYKNKVVEYQHWSRNNVVITRKESFSQGAANCGSHQQPAIDMINPDGLELAYHADYNWEIVELISRDGGPWTTWLFPDVVTDVEKNRLTQLLDLDLYTALENDGWALDLTEYWFYGPLEVKEIK